MFFGLLIISVQAATFRTEQKIKRDCDLKQVAAIATFCKQAGRPGYYGAPLRTRVYRGAQTDPILGQQTRGNGMPSVNLNTTPAPKLKQLFLQYNISGLDKVLSSRAKSESARGSSIRVDGQTTLRFVSSSQSWSIRTDVQFGLASLSLWSVYVQRGGNWMLEQRIVIPD